MRFPVIVSLVGIAGLVGGVLISLIQSYPVISGLPRNWVEAVYEMDSLMLRGTIQSINTKEKYIVVNAVSPYLLQENMQMRIGYNDNTTIQSVPLISQTPRVSVYSLSRTRKIDAGELSVGAYVFVRIARTAGAFQASYVNTGIDDPKHNYLR